MRLKHLAAVPIVNGVGERAEFDEPNWPRYIRTTDIAGPRSLRNDTFKSLPPAIAEQARLQPDDLVMTAAGTIGKSYLHTSGKPACFAGYLVRFRARPDTDVRFVAYWTESAGYWQQIESQHVKATIENFSAGRYRNLIIDVPPYAVQRRIADFLDLETARIDAFASRKKLLRHALGERWPAELRFLVTGAEEPTDGGARAPWLGPVKARWPVVRLGRLVRFFSGTTFPDAFQGKIEGDYPFVKVADLASGDGVWVDDAGNWVTREAAAALRARIVPNNSILYPRVGAALLLNQRRITARDVIVDDNLRGLQFGRGEPAYWHAVLSLLDLAQFATPGLVPSIGEDAVASITVPCPSDEEQRTIVDNLERRRAKYAALREGLGKQLDALLEHRQALITAAVTGGMDLPNKAA